jgi:hypothetical protein
LAAMASSELIMDQPSSAWPVRGSTPAGSAAHISHGRITQHAASKKQALPPKAGSQQAGQGQPSTWVLAEPLLE